MPFVTVLTGHSTDLMIKQQEYSIPKWRGIGK